MDVRGLSRCFSFQSFMLSDVVMVDLITLEDMRVHLLVLYHMQRMLLFSLRVTARLMTPLRHIALIENP